MSFDSFKNGMNRKNTMAIKWDQTEEIFGYPELNPMWIADSDYPTCPEIVQALVERAKHPAYGYTFPNDEYKTAVKNWIKRHHYYDIDQDDIIVTPGIVNALFFIVKKFTKEFDNVVVSTPVYNPFYRVIEKNNRNIVRNKLIEVYDTYKIDFIDLEEKIKNAKMYILCNPHNPIGRVWTKDEVTKIYNLCKKYDCFLVSDEIHGDIIYEPNKLYSAGNFLGDYDKLIICTAPSKTFNVAGLCDSNIIVHNKELRDELQEELDNYSIEPNAFGLTACMAAYKYGDDWAKEQNQYLYENYLLVKDFFNKNIREAKVYKLEGTYLVWINLTFLKLSQDELLKRLMEEKVLVGNGTVYDEKYVGYIRLNIACGRSQLMDALEKIKKVCSK